MTNFIFTFTRARNQVTHCCKNIMDQNKSYFKSYVLTNYSVETTARGCERPSERKDTHIAERLD